MQKGGLSRSVAFGNIHTYSPENLKKERGEQAVCGAILHGYCKFCD